MCQFNTKEGLIIIYNNQRAPSSSSLTDRQFDELTQNFIHSRGHKEIKWASTKLLLLLLRLLLPIFIEQMQTSQTRKIGTSTWQICNSCLLSLGNFLILYLEQQATSTQVLYSSLQYVVLHHVIVHCLAGKLSRHWFPVATVGTREILAAIDMFCHSNDSLHSTCCSCT